MSEERDLETAIADLRSEADALDRAHANVPPARLREWAAIFERAAEDYLTFISEGEASIRSGRSEATIRGKYEALARAGHARTVRGRRQYRQMMIPRRAQIDEAAERGREAARAVREQNERKAS